MNALSLEKLCAAYGKVQVLWGIDLHVEEGEFVTVVGSNGAGKTTMLRTISSLIRASSGSIGFFGQDITNAPSGQIVRLGLTHVPEGRQLFPAMTVSDNLELGASPKSAAWAVREQTRREMFALFPRLEERKLQLAGTLSGGEQQMLAIGRALMSRPKLILLDEPSLGLAPKFVQEVFNAIQSINSEGVGVMLIEQNAKKALEIADYGYVLEHGRIVLEGTGAELRENENVKELYLGMTHQPETGVGRFRRKKRWN
jgi:branched-chain amino acid transport system ATP-binding protein